MAKSVSHDLVARLSESQKACLRNVGRGMTSKEIARELDLTPSTVDTYLTRAMARLDAHNRRDAARLLADVEQSQNLRSQPEAVATAAESTILISSPGRPKSAYSRFFGLPPVGGEVNDLDWAARHYAILRVGAFGIIVLVALTLVIAGLLWAFE